MPSIRDFRSSMSTSGSVCSSPIPPIRRLKLIAPPVAIIVLLGMQSHRWAAPPITSRSITVTLAPSRAAYVAAWLPAGPPPMMTKRTVTRQRLRHSAVSCAPGSPIGYVAEVRVETGDAAPRGRSRPRLRRAPSVRFDCGRATGGVRAVARRVGDLVARLADPLEVHAVGRRQLPPHAKPCLRKMRTTSQFMCGAQPWQFDVVFMSSATA